MATSAKNTEQISKFGGLGACPLGIFLFFDNANCCKLGNFSIFCQAFGGGAWPPWPSPLEPPMQLLSGLMNEEQMRQFSLRINLIHFDQIDDKLGLVTNLDLKYQEL